MDQFSADRNAFAGELLARNRENWRRNREARQLKISRYQYDQLIAENNRHIANVRALEDRLVAGINWLGFTAWSECEEARRDRLHDPARYEKIENIWIATLRQYEWALRELQIRGIPYQCQPLEGVADPHPLYEIIEQDFYLTAGPV